MPHSQSYNVTTIDVPQPHIKCDVKPSKYDVKPSLSCDLPQPHVKYDDKSSKYEVKPSHTMSCDLPQPHFKYDDKSSKGLKCSGWYPFVSAGVLAIVFLVSIYLFGGNRIFMTRVNLHHGLVPILKQGELRVYPFMDVSRDGIRSSYSISLPPNDAQETVNDMKAVLESYPPDQGSPYTNCWLENPLPEAPCFFDASWIQETCTSNHSYGYEENSGYFEPCFIIRLEETGTWTPLYYRDDTFHNDPSFLPVQCLITEKGMDSAVNMTLYPPKGFSRLFFPASRFEPEVYLPPFVALKVYGIRKEENVIIECSVVTPNAFMLWNNGRAIINIVSAA